MLSPARPSGLGPKEPPRPPQQAGRQRRLHRVGKGNCEKSLHNLQFTIRIDANHSHKLTHKLTQNKRPVRPSAACCGFLLGRDHAATESEEC